jgi:hypothetical protein
MNLFEFILYLWLQKQNLFYNHLLFIISKMNFGNRNVFSYHTRLNNLIDKNKPDFNFESFDEPPFETDVDDVLLENIPVENGSVQSQERKVKSDTLSEILFNNPLLTDNYLSGSELVQSNIRNEIPMFNEPLYEGANFSLEDLLLILELIKCSNNFGDTNESIILGLLGSFLPKGNLIYKLLSETSGSIFYFQKLLKRGATGFDKCSIHKIILCSKGCSAFVGAKQYNSRCSTCFEITTDININTKYMYYLPLKDRLIKLLLSDLRNLFHYPELRSKGNEAFVEDTYDGSCWKSFDRVMDKGKGEKLIGLQWCWDGADAFTFSGKSFWPGCFSILNFPKDLRGKLHIGMHVTTLCAGTLFT